MSRGRSGAPLAEIPTPPATAGVDAGLVLLQLHPGGHGLTDHFNLVGYLILHLLEQVNGLEVALR
jgi:hypothetical protein